MDPTVEFSAINTLRTGNMIVDMGIAMVVPATLRALYNNDMWSKLFHVYRKHWNPWLSETMVIPANPP